MSEPTVSVVIPTHNRPAECLVAVRSALAQTAPPTEVIVVDDHSNDGDSRALGDALSGEQAVTLISRSAGPRGPAAARNAGIEAAGGSLVAFLDDDDEWLPEKLERQLPWFARGYEVVCSNARRSSGGQYFETSGDHGISRDELLAHNPVIFSTAVVNRSLLDRAGRLDESGHLIGIEDYELLLRLSDESARMVRVGDCLAVYRDDGYERLSNKKAQMAAAVARMSARRSLRRPFDTAQHRATVRNVTTALLTAPG
ncbi:MAG: glycosyltransferase family 2 protein [Acidobacteria bacterium]|nr:glycosyltransferase family 2 protein [Acidobacteriota bacterium]